MLVIYKLDTLDVEHCVTIAADTFTDMIDADPARGWVRMDGDAAPNEIALTQKDGVVTASLRAPFPFAVPASATVGVEVRITGVPTGTQITSETGTATMVSSGILDLTFGVAGSYPLTFTHPSYLTLSAAIEVSA